MSSVSLGKAAERDCRNDLLLEEYKVFSPQSTSFFGTQDMFNMWDVMALNETGLRFIQVKKTSTQGFLKKLNAWAERYQITNITWELWVRKDTRKYNSKWRKYVFYMGNQMDLK